MILDANTKLDDLSPGLLRQRRNLFIFGFATLLFTIGGAELTKLNLLGNEVSIESQVFVMVIIFCLYIYFFWRYHQYCLKEKNLGKARLAYQNDVRNAELDYFKRKVSDKIALFNADHVYPSFEINRQALIDTIDASQIADYKSSSFLKRQRLLFIGGTGGVFEFFNNRVSVDDDGEFSSTLAEIHKFWEQCPPDKNRSTSDPIYRAKIDYNIFRIFILRFQSYLKFVFSKTYFTDYYIPYVFAWLTLIISILSEYNSLT